MKVFSDVVDSARASWILNALKDCVILGVDVINMSLGTACGFSRGSDEEITSGVYEKIRSAGIGLVVAASNSYSSAYGSEKNGNLVLTSDPYFEESNDGAMEENNFCETLLGDEDKKSFDYVIIPGVVILMRQYVVENFPDMTAEPSPICPQWADGFPSVIPRPPRPKAKDVWNTYWAAVKMMVGPTLTVICALCIIYMVLYAVFLFLQ